MFNIAFALLLSSHEEYRESGIAPDSTTDEIIRTLL